MEEKNLVREMREKKGRGKKGSKYLKDILRKMKVRNVHKSMVSDIVLWDI